MSTHKDFFPTHTNTWTSIVTVDSNGGTCVSYVPINDPVLREQILNRDKVLIQQNNRNNGIM